MLKGKKTMILCDLSSVRTQFFIEPLGDHITCTTWLYLQPCSDDKMNLLVTFSNGQDEQKLILLKPPM